MYHTAANVLFIQIVCEYSDVLASACAAARAFPLFTRKSSYSGSKRNVTVEFLLVGGSTEQALSEEDIACVSDAAYGIRLAARLTDTPCADMHTEAFVEVGHVIKPFLDNK